MNLPELEARYGDSPVTSNSQVGADLLRERRDNAPRQGRGRESRVGGAAARRSCLSDPGSGVGWPKFGRPVLGYTGTKFARNGRLNVQRSRFFSGQKKTFLSRKAMFKIRIPEFLKFRIPDF